MEAGRPGPRGASAARAVAPASSYASARATTLRLDTAAECVWGRAGMRGEDNEAHTYHTMPPADMNVSTGSATKGCPVRSPSSGPRGAPGPSAAPSVGAASTPGSAPVKTATAVQDVHWWEKREHLSVYVGCFNETRPTREAVKSPIIDGSCVFHFPS